MTFPTATKDTTYDIPDHNTLTKIATLPITREDGTHIPFSSLYTNPDQNPGTKHLIIFIRHFYCGSCQSYVETLNHNASTFQKHNIVITIIGNGHPTGIAPYRAKTATSFPICTDPKRELYAALGMTVTLSAGEKQPEYIPGSMLANALKSTWNAVTSPAVWGGKAGNFAQNGGELLFVRGDLKWCHRMLNTRDHAESGELMEVCDVQALDAGMADGK
ncbi:Thioredoxin-like protein AAED1 [Cyphellophora attinorum]|uniref:Thioredoxin-like protein AAED1 n=1 Tax=Cyphellophora attinorum TaxID=1664694 RepID=A0A0N1H3Q4_9EURO|nr:Thioredoxin-like protein AAED1 [Phialophora attinorum]KPI39706.1 Thioredoxin-like protein AAED1 [Phialophora attinorum]